MIYYSRAFADILNTSKGERKVAAFLKRAPAIVMKVFNTGNNTHLLVPEFRFGNRMRADFCVISGHSGGWEMHLVELEPVGAKFFLSDGTDSISLRKAKRQVADWHQYIQTHTRDFREELARCAISKNVYYRSRYDRGSAEYYRGRLMDENYSFKCDYKIVMGRRSSIDGVDVQRRSYYHEFNRCDLVTYDRLLEAAIELDSHTKALMSHRRYSTNTAYDAAYAEKKRALLLELLKGEQRESDSED